MKTLFLLFFFWLFAPAAHTQTNIPASLPDSCFDVFVYSFHPEQARQAETRLAKQLDSLLQATHHDTLTLARVYRRLGVAYHMISDHERARESHRTSLQLLYTLKPVPEADLAQTLHNYSTSLVKSAVYDSLFWCLEKAVEINSRLYGPEHERVAVNYCFIAGYCINIAKINQGLEYARKAVAIFQKSGKAEHPYMVRALQVRGVLFGETENYQAAFRDYFEAEGIARQTLDPLHPLLTNIYSAIGRLLRFEGDYDGAYDYLNRCLAIREQTLGSQHELTGYTSMALGEIALELRDTMRAVQHFERNFEILKKNFGELPLDKYPFMIGLYRGVGDFRKAEEAFNYVNKRYAVDEFTRKDIAYCYGEHATALLQQQRFEEAMMWFEKERDLHLIQNPDEPSVLYKNRLNMATCQRMLNRLDEAAADMRTILADKPQNKVLKLAYTELGEIDLARYAQSRNPENLADAREHFYTALLYMDSMRYTIPSMGSRVQQSSQNFHIFDKAIQTAALRQQPEEAFQLAEKSKTQTLLEDIQYNEALMATQLPDSLLKVERELKTEIADLEKQIFKSIKGRGSISDNARLFEQKRALSAFIDNLEKNYPGYFRLKYNTVQAPLATLQQSLLNDSTALIEYFTGDSTLYVFTVTSDSIYWSHQPKPAGLEKTIMRLRKSINDAQLRYLGQDFPLFASCSVQLYEDLLAAPFSGLSPKVQHLIIVADGLLNYVPFEVLGKSDTDPTDFRDFPYLLRRYHVSYAGSANLLLEQQKQLQKLQLDPAPDLFAGFAPSYSGNDTMRATGARYRALLVRNGQYGLPGAIQEVKEISSLMEGDAFLNNQADEGSFKRQAPRYRILHLAMHSLVEDNNPLFSRLLFTKNTRDNAEDNELMAIELYAMRLAAEMVVLSACNTAVGKMYKGEGVMNLSRAFTATGVPSTVVSLWQAPDEATRKVMVSFYQYLKQGKNKDSALCQAKLDFIAACKNPALANPFFWGGFIGIGSMHPLGIPK